jgi:hypothetical protein
MNRFLAVRRFLDGEIGTFEEMADKIENLSLESAIRIQEDYSPRLHRILRGELITPALDDWLRTRFELHEYRTIVDFNQAARYVRGLTPSVPDSAAWPFPAPWKEISTFRSSRDGIIRSS